MSYNDGTYTLLENASATGNPFEWQGGRGVFAVPSGTFSGATVKLQWSPDSTNWLDVDQGGDTYVTLTAAGAGLFEMPKCFIKATITGSPTGIYATAKVIGR